MRRLFDLLTHRLQEPNIRRMAECSVRADKPSSHQNSSNGQHMTFVWVQAPACGLRCGLRTNRLFLIQLHRQHQPE